MKTRETKAAIIDELTENLNNYSHFYLTDISGLNSSATLDLRGECYKQDIKLVMVKNTLFKRALQNAGVDYSEYEELLDGPSSVMFTETGNAPAKLIKKLRKKYSKPVIKAAVVEEMVYKGDDQLDTLEKVKSKEELVADIVQLLNSPINNVMSSLNSGSNIITGVLKTLEDKE